MEVHALARTALDRLAEMSSDQAALVFLVVLCFLYFLARFPATSSRIVAWMEKAGSFGMILSLGLVSLLAVVPTTYHHALAAATLVCGAPTVVRWLVADDLPRHPSRKKQR